MVAASIAAATIMLERFMENVPPQKLLSLLSEIATCDVIGIGKIPDQGRENTRKIAKNTRTIMTKSTHPDKEIDTGYIGLDTTIGGTIGR
jgi:hypothetical protein